MLTTFIPSLKFVYLIQCSAVDIQTHSFPIQTVPASLPAVGQYYLRLHTFDFFLLVMKGFKVVVVDAIVKYVGEDGDIVQRLILRG